MIYLKPLSIDDGIDVFEMLKGIKSVENSFTNPVYKMDFQEFKKWLIQQESWSRGEKLPEGFVSQSIYWLYDNNIPVGFGKIRHELTAQSRLNGGNIGYAINCNYRNKGYGYEVLRLLLIEAKKIGVDEIILTVDIGNIGSRRVIEKNGGILDNENSERWYFRF